jgi:hypothetical protein
MFLKPTRQFHSDDERGLGPVVAALSLGSSAVMSFRPKGPSKSSACRGPSTPRQKNSDVALKLELRHVSYCLDFLRSVPERFK